MNEASKDLAFAAMGVRGGDPTGEHYEFTHRNAQKVGIADWNQNNPYAPDYVKNRTHYVIPAETIMVEEQTVTIGEERYCKLAGRGDLVEGCLYSISFNGVRGDLTAKYGANWGCVYLGNGSFVEETDDDGIPFAINAYPEDDEIYLNVSEEGTYTIKIVCLDDAVRKLDAKYLPDGIGGGEAYDLDVTADGSGNFTVHAGSFDSLYEKLSNAEPVNCRIRNIYNNFCYTCVVVEIHYDGDDDEIYISALTHDSVARFYLNRNNEFTRGSGNMFSFQS